MIKGAAGISEDFCGVVRLLQTRRTEVLGRAARDVHCKLPSLTGYQN